jgi:hypothetical protein
MSVSSQVMSSDSDNGWVQLKDVTAGLLSGLDKRKAESTALSRSPKQ